MEEKSLTETLLDDVRAAMEEQIARILQEKARREELSAVPGQVECLAGHWRGGTLPHDAALLDGDPCPGCGAAL